MDNKKPTFKFKTNIPQKIHFQFSEPKTGNGQYGAWYLWGVQINGQDMGMFASQGLQDKLSQLGSLRGRVLEITKIEGDDNRTFWQIKDEQENDITPGFQAKPKNEEKPKSSIEERLDKAASVVKQLMKRIEEMEKDVKGLKSIIPDDKLEAFELGKSYSPQIPIGEKPVEPKDF